MHRFINALVDELPFIVSLPAYLWEVYFLFIPLFFIGMYSFTPIVNGVHIGGVVTLTHYTKLFSSTYAQITYNSLLLAVVTAVICLICAYPVAYFLALRAGRFKNILLVFLILPSWTSFIIQIYSWFFILQKNGLLNVILQRLGVIQGSVTFLNSYPSTVLGMVYCFLPFMIFPIFTVLEKMDKKLLEASADLGASRWQTFRRVILPLSLPGIKVGMLLVMVPAFGEFAVPDLMGGFKDMYIGRVVMEKFLLYRDWYSGAAVVMASVIFPILLLLSGALVSALIRKIRLYREQVV